jgi:hypothetical protein
MRDLQSSERAALRVYQVETLQDTCIVQTRSEAATDPYGEGGATYTPGSPIRCGYKARSSREVQQGNETVLIDGELRLPHGTAIVSLDRVQVTKRYGETLTPPLLFYVVGQPAIGVSGVVVSLKRVTDG